MLPKKTKWSSALKFDFLRSTPNHEEDFFKFSLLFRKFQLTTRREIRLLIQKGFYPKYHCGLLNYVPIRQYKISHFFNFLFRNSGRQLVAPTEPETFPFRTVQNQRTIDDNVIEDSIDNRQEPMNLRTVKETLFTLST